VTDEDIYRSLTAKPESAAAVERLRVQMVEGDSYGVKGAVEGLLEFSTGREVAVVKRWLSATARREG
jgi:hypothetical protein